MKEKIIGLNKYKQVYSFILITMLVFHACKKKKCPEDLSSDLKNYVSNFSAGKVIQYKNQYNETIVFPPSMGITYQDIYDKKQTGFCTVECNVNTSTSSIDTLYFGLKIWGDINKIGGPPNPSDPYWYTYYISIGNSNIYKKDYDFTYYHTDPPTGYPSTLSKDSTVYHDTYLIGGINYSQVFQVIIKDSSNYKPFLKQYFFNKDKTFIQMEERYTDKIWVLQ